LIVSTATQYARELVYPQRSEVLELCVESGLGRDGAAPVLAVQHAYRDSAIIRRRVNVEERGAKDQGPNAAAA
jgi:hypothetical protein